MTDKASGECAKMAQNLPVVIEPRAERPSLARYTLPASFVSHLIAEREHLSVQKRTYRTSSGNATRAYSAGARIAVKRMPSGFRHSSTI